MEAHVRISQWAMAAAAATTIAALVATVPGVAHADVGPGDPGVGSVGIESDGTLYFFDDNVDNDIVIENDYYNQYILVTDTKAPIFGYPGCGNITDHQVQCGYGGKPTRLRVNAGWGDDKVTNNVRWPNVNTAFIYGGLGDDIIYGGPGSIQLFAGETKQEQGTGEPEAGNDQLFGGCPTSCADAADYLHGLPGDDVLSGGAGNDTLYGDEGNDAFTGGAGTDTYLDSGGTADSISYADKTVQVMINLNGLADDGEQYEQENIPAGFEAFYGGSGKDIMRLGSSTAPLLIRGGAGDDDLCAGPKNDVIYGGAGNDAICDGKGLDRMYGEAGNDHLFGGEDSDQLYGGPGDDDLDGSVADDVLYGEAGNDHLSGGEGSDQMYGGPGDDFLWGSLGLDYAYELPDEGVDRCQAETVENCEEILTSALAPYLLTH
jgi:Ca2+-binding RTX toxin-like protein